MIELTSSTNGPRMCDGVSRRTALQVGTLGPIGLALPHVLGRQARAATDSSFGRAKRIILLFMWGGPAHQDTWDLKPDGPADLRGEFSPIATTSPEVSISEHFPHIARHGDKLAIIRSVGQEDNNHTTGAHAGLTGRRHTLKQENFAARSTDFPHYGSVLSRLSPNRDGMPTFVSLPEVIATTNGTITPGQFGGLLGRSFDPFQISQHPDEDSFAIESLRIPAGLSVGRMNGRRDLLQTVDRVARLADRSVRSAEMSSFYERALDMVLSPRARKAFDLSSVPEAERWRYGWHTFGQSVLMARRLVESGVKLVTVYWHRERPALDTSWDTHSRNSQELKSRLMPAVDRPIAALLEDLHRSGQLDETLVVWNSEFGRTPKINGNAGRDHWGPCNSVVMAGGGVPGGQVFGSSDAAAAYPLHDKVTQDDIAATIYHLLGFSSETMIHDAQDRPWPIALGEPIHGLLGSTPRPKQSPAVREPVRRTTFETMLRERARRYLLCEFGNAKSERVWKLDGWSAPVLESSVGYRRATTESVITFTGAFFAHFDYECIVLYLAKSSGDTPPAVTLNGMALPISADLRPQLDGRLWQISIPRGTIGQQGKLSFKLDVENWAVSAFALLGDPIDDRFLAKFFA